MDKIIHMSREDYEYMLNHALEVGHGTDGIVFKYNHKYLFKLYRNSITNYPGVTVTDFEDTDMKLYVMKKDRTPEQEKEFNKISTNDKQQLTYYKKDDDIPEHDTKLAGGAAILAAIDRQKNVTQTKLPVAAVYLNSKCIGCIVERLRGIEIHKLRWLPLKARVYIIENVIDQLEELMNNFIYHRDLSNSPYADVVYKNQNGEYVRDKGHSHVLVNPVTLQTNIIDLDGKSTIYTEHEDIELAKQSIKELLVLVFEYLLYIDLVDYSPVSYEDDYSYLINLLERKGYESDQIDEFTEDSFTSIETIDNVRKLVKEINTK